MRKKGRLYIITFLVLFGNFFTSAIPIKSLSSESIKNITSEYLNNLPQNDYIIGPGDELSFIVSRNYPELDSLTIVDSEGTIYLPKLNRIYVSGLNLTELKSLLNEAFKKYVKYPDVEIVVEKYRPIRVFVKGEVINPGLISLSGSLRIENKKDKKDKFQIIYDEKESKIKSLPNIKYEYNDIRFFFPTVFDAIRESGGITEYSDLSNIQIIRQNKLSNGGGKITTSLDFEKALLNGDSSQNIRIYDSDIIVVSKTKIPNNYLLGKANFSRLNPKTISVQVAGRVNIPGKIKLSRSSVLSDAIDIDGGAKVVKGRLSFIRFNSDVSIDKRNFRFNRNKKRGSYKNPFLKDGDLIFIGNSFVSNIGEVIADVTSPLSGIVSSYDLYKALTND